MLSACLASVAVLAACRSRGERLTSTDSASVAPPVADAGVPATMAPAVAPAPSAADIEGAADMTEAAIASRPMRQAAVPERGLAGTPGLADVDLAGAMLVRQGQAALEVRHVDEAVGRIRQAASQHGGFVSNASIRGGRDETRAASLELRVPSAQFDDLLAGLPQLGKVESVTASANDVGDEYVDLTARAANARRTEARLIEMLATRTGKLSDVLTMEQELARVREEIERHEGRLKHLSRRSTLSTLVVTLHEPLALIERPNNGPIAEAFAAAWERALGVAAWCIAMLGLVIPVALLIFGGVLLGRWVRRRYPAVDLSEHPGS